MAVQVIMPGSCGELVQGKINGLDFHITCPVNRFSKVTLATIKEKTISFNGSLSKTAEAVKKCLEVLEIESGIKITIESELPQGKGMASSTADISAAVTAAFALFGRDLSPLEVADIALSIEPTDGIIFEGIVAFDHLHGRKLDVIGDAPPLDIVVLEPPHAVDTVAFNLKKVTSNDAEDHLHKETFAMVTEGIETLDLRLVAEAATLSAVLNQELLFKPELDDIIEISRRRGGLGVNVAHSGTVMGMLVERGFAGRLLDKIAHYVPRSWKAYTASMISGGAIAEPDDITSIDINKVVV